MNMIYIEDIMGQYHHSPKWLFVMWYLLKLCIYIHCSNTAVNKFEKYRKNTIIFETMLI